MKLDAGPTVPFPPPPAIPTGLGHANVSGHVLPTANSGRLWMDCYPPPLSRDWESWILKAADNEVPCQTVTSLIKQASKNQVICVPKQLTANYH